MLAAAGITAAWVRDMHFFLIKINMRSHFSRPRISEQLNVDERVIDVD